MRIVQVIDSLEAGGAERIAVSYANGLAHRIECSGLVATRAEGSLKQDVADSVAYLFLRKRYTLDILAAFRLRKFCVRHRITIIHAHSTSYFVAIMTKFMLPRIAIIWHDHNGSSEFLDMREAVPLNVASCLFRGIIVVNNQLKDWALRMLHCPNILYIPNFTIQEPATKAETILSGMPGKRVLLLANLREQKDHFTCLRAASLVKKTHPDWTFHLVGKDFNDAYAHDVRQQIAAEGLESSVFVYGSKPDTGNIISQADICILTSKSEGLPVALLEYGMHEKPVVVTAVGEIPLIVREGENGLLVTKKDAGGFALALTRLMDDAALRRKLASGLKETVASQHSETAALDKYLHWVKSTIDG